MDVFLVQNGYYPSRERAQAAIIAGAVYINGACVRKPGQTVSDTDAIEVRGREVPYVSRGGLKLEHALKAFNINLDAKVVIDAGASTGGFVDCALAAGARRVYAVDVGYGQLAWKLRTDPRVVVLERTNVRYLDPNTLDEPPDFATIDLSFISLEKVLPQIGRLLKPEGEGVALVKPQFEAGPEKVGKKGVVRDAATHLIVCRRIVQFIGSLNWEVLNFTFSPIKGPEGNIEFLVYFSKAAGQSWEGSISEIVDAAWDFFDKGKVLPEH